MFSRFHKTSRSAGWLAHGLVLALTITLAACESKETGQQTPAQAAEKHEKMVIHGPGMHNPSIPVDTPDLSDREFINEGKRLYNWFNCVGCHANGGGGMGPPLIDEAWIYGSEPIHIYSTIVEGRPNGMPAFGSKIPEEEIWKLVAYVRALGGLGNNLLEGATNRPLQDKAATDLDEGGH